MKLHVGCGEIHLSGYENIDIRFLPGVDEVDNAAYLRKFRGKSISEIYACHVLEHFTRWEVKNVLHRWYNLLEPKGLLRLSVPDFQAIAFAYANDWELEDLMGLLYGGQDYAENFHYHVWDYVSLKACLEKIGFKNIAKYNWHDHKCGVDDYSKCYLPHKDFENGMLMSLNVVAEKPNE